MKSKKTSDKKDSSVLPDFIKTLVRLTDKEESIQKILSDNSKFLKSEDVPRTDSGFPDWYRYGYKTRRSFNISIGKLDLRKVYKEPSLTFNVEIMHGSTGDGCSKEELSNYFVDKA